MTHLRSWVCLGFLAGVAALAGCGQSPFAPVPKGGGGNAGGNNQPLDLVGKIKKKADFLSYSNEMKQLAQLYYMCCADRGFQPPKIIKEFEDYVGKGDGAQLVKWMNDGYYFVLPNTQPNSNNIIVYQTKDLTGGTRWVAYGDARIEELPEAEFQQKLKQQLQQ